MIFNKDDRDKIAEHVSSQFRLMFPEQVGRPACLHWTWLGIKAIDQAIREKDLAASAVLQAGTALWPYAKDNGTNNTHAGYEWEGPGVEELNKLAEATGNLREVHFWVGILPRIDGEFEPEFVDFAVGNWPNLFPVEWDESLLPPDYLWAPVNALPDGVYYKADIRAIQYAIRGLNLLRAQGALV